MSTDDTNDGPDKVPGAPHPRETQRLFGQDEAEAAFLDAHGSGRMHHAWLITGPKGIGKATLAWRIARFLVATPEATGDDDMFGAPLPPESLDIPADHPVSRRILAGAEPGITSITRTLSDTGRMRDVIVVDDVRKLSRYFGLSSADGGHRVVIVDAADEMNDSAANALLKMLEEPPKRATLLLIAHQPSRLLPTIRSRCRTLRLSPLAPDDLAAALEQAGAELPADPGALAALAGGSAGTALELLSGDGLGLYARLMAILNSLPSLDRQLALALAESAAARGAGAKFDLLLALLDIAMARLARTGATGSAPRPEAAPGEAELMARLAPSPQKGRDWAEAAAHISARARHGRAVNLDPAALVLDTVFQLQATAQR
ncbi:DNA polymerase III subunit delta' [Chachezhania antarctica]|uniref:DNA polymerase III subunit delta' n=1 Tax=Chachezhania antarctica TaxID=2340860 RepID=UPI000EB58C82|nr:DNA polymerase III subunit delta' [Chachezhania antarctica]